MKTSIEQLSGIWLGALVAVMLLGLVATPHDPMALTFIDRALAPPSWAHPLGIDGVGRDYLSRVWLGAAHTLVMGLAGAAGALGLASALVAVEQSAPRPVSRAVRWLMGVWIGIPVIFAALLLLVVLRPSPATLVLAAAVGAVPLGFRQLRILWREQRAADYVRASEVLGASRWGLARAIWPNLRPDVWALSKLIFAVAVLELSGLAFLGLVGDPDFPELGALLRENQRYLFQRPSLLLWPGLVLSSLLLSVHLTGLARRE